ncbi:putative protein SCAI [Helianthus annuus]|nr:putative protein SCAI [Helianthus annuus]
MCEELPADGILLIYISASGSGVHASISPSHIGNVGDTENVSNTIRSDTVTTLPSCSACDTLTSSLDYSGGLNLGPGANGGAIYSLIAINRAEKGEQVAILLSPVLSFPLHGAIDPPLPGGSQFTSFLTVPLQAFVILLGFSGSDIQTVYLYIFQLTEIIVLPLLEIIFFQENLNKAQKILSSSLNKWGEMLASSDTIHPVWAQVLGDPFLRRLLLRFIFCRAVFALYAPTSSKKEYLPECSPSLPDAFLPTTPSSIATVLQIADIFGAATMFNNRERIVLPDEQFSSP